MLFFIQFWRILSFDGYAFSATPALRSHRCDMGAPMPLRATRKFFFLQVEPTGMLAPEVQATTIDCKGTPWVGWESMVVRQGEPWIRGFTRLRLLHRRPKPEPHALVPNP